MSISGQNVAQQLARAIQDVQSELTDARRRSANTAHEIEEIRDDRDRALADLARIYLPVLTRDALLQTWSEARTPIEQMLTRKDQHVSKLKRELTDLDISKTDAEAELSAASELLDQHIQQQQSVATKLSEILSQDPEFAKLTDRAAAAEASLERAEASLEQIEHEANQKLPAYENSKLFTYLYRRGLATPAYSASGFTRRMDRWVGRLIDYPKAKIGYDYLKSMPEQVRTLVAQDREALKLVMTDLEKRRDTEGEKLGLPEIIAKVQQSDANRTQIIARIEQIRLRTAEAGKELADVERSDGPYYQEAIGYFKSLLEASDPATLEMRARRTPDPNDDQIVARLNALDGDAREATSETNALQRRIDWLDRHLSELGSFQQRFRSARYDSSQSEFDGSFDLQNDMRRVLEGHDSLENVWNRLRRSQRFAPSPMENLGSGLAGAASHPLTQVLVYAMANAATTSMTDHAKRAGSRHAGSVTQAQRPAGHYSPARTSQTKPQPAAESQSRGDQKNGGFYTSRKI